MKMNNGIGNFSRSSSTRSAKRSVVLPKSSYSTPTTGSTPRSPSLNYQLRDPPKSPTFSDQKSPNYPKSPKMEHISLKSPKVSLSSPSQTERIFDFGEHDPRSPTMPMKSPRSPRNFNYDEDTKDIAGSSECDNYSINLSSPPKTASKIYNRQVYQSSKSDSVNSTKSSLEYSSTTKHPTGAYQDIEYKICHSLDSDSQTTSSYRYSTTSTSSRHSSFKEKKRPKCNIRTNPGYDERYSSSKSINESERAEKPLQRCRCRKSTSDLTDLTADTDIGNTMTTSLSRPSSPRRKGSVKGGLAYLASRRGSRDSIASNASNVSNEDIGPLNFQNTARGRQRRTSNFLELPEKHEGILQELGVFMDIVIPKDGYHFKEHLQQYHKDYLRPM